MIEGCIGTAHWEACEMCKKYHQKKGCTIDAEDGFYVEFRDYIICDYYEKREV